MRKWVSSRVVIRGAENRTIAPELIEAEGVGKLREDVDEELFSMSIAFTGHSGALFGNRPLVARCVGGRELLNATG